ncbi:ribonuclease T2 [Tothia fuscella]|uniref:ribonuclease T2 n=1 Tax=Tothia fuscella TaxID=1048955 RepID=A0A9P4TS03_9PEZI|nr:ribonuclease T2 [Tothia fuscella]
MNLMMKHYQLIPIAAAVAPLASASLYGQSNLNHSCVLSPKLLSCSPPTLHSNASRLLDTCCVETYGGLLLSTQFWSTYTGLEAQGQKLPKDTWTIHGMWPDFCNGSYTQYCDLNRQYDPVPSPNTTNGLRNGTVVPAYKGANVGTFLEKLGKFDLLAYMNKFWINQGAPNTDFWAHEFSKHGTCMSTFDTPCYGPSYVEHEDVVDFFETTILYDQRLPTWGWLSAANVRPSNSTNYTLSEFQSALSKGYGALPYIGCSGPRYNNTVAGAGSRDTGFTVISEVWYYYNVFGHPREGNWIHLNATGSNSSCATTRGALRYLERTPGSLQ